MPHSSFRSVGGRLESAYVVVTLVLLAEAILVPLRAASLPNGFDPTTGDLPLQVMWLSINASATCLLLARWRQSLPVLRSMVLVWLLVGLAVISPLWSSAPNVSVRRSVALVGSTLFGVYLASSFSLQRQISLLAAALGIAAVSSLIFVFMLPSYGIDAEGHWQGAFLTKNTMGKAMTLCVVALLLTQPRSRLTRFIKLGLMAIAVGLLIGAGSSTAFVVLPLLIASLLSARVLRWPLGLSAPILVMVLSVSSAVVSWTSDNAAEALGVLGKNTTLTGRTQLWEDVIGQIQNRPFLGYGFGGFWLGWSGPSAKIWAETNWFPPHSHNGILDLWLDLGFVGVLLFSIGFVVALGRAVLLAHGSHDRSELWPIVYLIFFFLYNLSESSILRQNTVYWVAYVAVFASLTSCARTATRPMALRGEDVRRSMRLGGQPRPVYP